MSEKNIKEMVDRLIRLNDENLIYNGYDEGHRDGYHDALVDLLDELNIKHNHEFYNN